MLKDIFGFAEAQKKCTYSLGYTVTLTRNSDSSVFNEANATITAKLLINGIEWYIPHYTLSIPQQAKLSKQIYIKVPTEFQLVERSVFMEEVNTQF